VGFTLNPQVHAFDDLTLHENLAAQAHALRAARHYFADLPVRVVVSLRLRYDPATRGQPEALKNDLPQSVDPRQRTSFAAEWTAQSLRILTEAGASAVAYYEAVGCKGILMGDTESPDIQYFPAERGDVFPVFEVLRKATST
jgi:D-apionolactonase